MIQGLIVKFLLKKIMEAIEKADDKRIARKHHRQIKELKKDIKDLKKDSHPSQEYICCRKCGCKIAKTKIKKRRKKSK